VQFVANNLYRERHLANNPHFAHRQEAFAQIPYKLDGSGATVPLVVDEIFELIEESTGLLIAKQKRNSKTWKHAFPSLENEAAAVKQFKTAINANRASSIPTNFAVVYPLSLARITHSSFQRLSI
jgi:hypothetical protein